MKLVYKEDRNLIGKDLQVQVKEKPCFDSSWHFHPEFELIFISRSCGIRYVGDNVSDFSAGELVLIGPNLPHLWKNDSSYSSIKTVVIKFNKSFIGEDTFKNPLFRDVNDLLTLSNYGVKFGRADSEKLKKEIFDLARLSPSEQSIQLLSILNRLAQLSNKEKLSTVDMRQLKTESSNRIDKVLKFISENYIRDINLEDVADVACMTTNSFCRFFKKSTNKSFITFLNEVRIKNAARLLVQEDYPVSDIGFKVGFNSITNFNKQFKQIMGLSPNEHRFSMYENRFENGSDTVKLVSA